LDRAIKTQEAIRTPLSVMRGYLELLKDGAMGPLSEAQMPTVQMIIDKTQAIMGLISRTIPPRMPHDAARYERIYLADLVRRAINRRLSVFEKAGIALVTQLPPPRDEESATLGDPDMLLRAFNALLDNAVKYSPDGGKLEVSLHVSGDIVYVRFSDSGIGIPSDLLVHIWKAQKHAGSSESITLAEVKRIVEGHGGQVWAESTPGQGSTFQVVLRRVER
jgi:signal transduction histidine kinase